MLKVTHENLEKIAKVVKENSEEDVYICLLGEYTYCYTMYDLLKSLPHNFKGVVIPITERQVKENENEKISIFEFVRWRVILR